MDFNVITIFPDIFKSYFKESIIKRAEKNNLLKLNIYNLRSFTKDKRKTIDDRPFGGGRGMVLRVEPIYKAVSKIKEKNPDKKTKVILFTPRGKKFNQKKASEWAKLDSLILICGRYEGIDERVAKYIADEKISIGNFVLMGGEIPAIAVIESVARLLPGVIGNSNLLKKRISSKEGFIEYPQYTRPELFEPEKGKKWKVPKVLLSGNHKEIQLWRDKHSKVIE